MLSQYGKRAFVYAGFVMRYLESAITWAFAAKPQY